MAVSFNPVTSYADRFIKQPEASAAAASNPSPMTPLDECSSLVGRLIKVSERDDDHPREEFLKVLVPLAAGLSMSPPEKVTSEWNRDLRLLSVYAGSAKMELIRDLVGVCGNNGTEVEEVLREEDRCTSVKCPVSWPNIGGSHWMKLDFRIKKASEQQIEKGLAGDLSIHFGLRHDRLQSPSDLSVRLL